MFECFVGAVEEILALAQDKLEFSAVAGSSLASNVLALDAQDEPLTPVLVC